MYGNNNLLMDFRTKDKSRLPLVTIGVMSYNYGMYILETLESIYFQTYPHIELFIVDDASTDNSVEVTRKWIKDRDVHCTFIKHETNKGRNTALSTILKNSNGKFVAWFATDDIMNPDRIQNQMKVMIDASENVAVCYSDAELINEQGEPRGLYSARQNSPFLEGNVFEKFFNEQFFMAAPTLLFRRSAIDLVGEYDVNLTAEDYGMWMQILPLYEVKYCDYPGVKYRIKENWKPTEAHQSNLQQWYHKDRVIIYVKLVQLLKSIKKYENIRLAATQKINYHLVHLQLMNSKYFGKMLRHLFSNSYYKVKFTRLFKNQVRNLFTRNKMNIVA